MGSCKPEWAFRRLQSREHQRLALANTSLEPRIPGFQGLALFRSTPSCEVPSFQLCCQPVVIGTNSRPTGIPSLGCAKKETLCSTNGSLVMQHSCETSMVVGQPGPFPLRPHLCHSALACAGLLCLCSAQVRHLRSQLSQGNAVLGGKGKCTLRTRGELHLAYVWLTLEEGQKPEYLLGGGPLVLHASPAR